MSSFDRNSLDSFPTQPGVYMMLGADSKVLYIGKAKNLRQRVRQYFLPRGDGRPTIPHLIAKVNTIDTIVVSSEKEALLLENNLIKQHQPHYNVLLKDDKTYFGLKVSDRDKWPMLSLVRYKGAPKPGASYFGPYTSAEAARKTLDLLQRLFPLRQCSDQEFAKRTRPCILYDMKRCIAPCVNKCSKEEYDTLVKQTMKFLKGQDREVVKELRAEMSRAAESLEFERAGEILRIIQKIEKTLEEQHVDQLYRGINADALGIYREGNEVVLTQLLFREGKLTGSRNYDFTDIVEEDDELIEAFMQQHYATHELPNEILLPFLPETSLVLEEIISASRQRIHLLAPQRGDKKALVEMAFENAKATFRRQKNAAAIKEKTLLEMQDRLHLTRYPKRIECFDNSNIAGTLVVSTLVAFLDGVKDTKRYRKYKIRGETGSDDYAAMREALERRYRRAKLEADLPDLLIIDGGKGHLNVALKVLDDLEIVSLDVISLAKEDGRHDRGATLEQVFLPHVKDPIKLRQNSPVLFLLQQIRDEAHRTAITFNRNLHLKKNMNSILDEIEGIGPAKRKQLLRHFGSLKRVLSATEEEIGNVKGLSQDNINNLINFIKLHKEPEK